MGMGGVLLLTGSQKEDGKVCADLMAYTSDDVLSSLPSTVCIGSCRSL